MGRKPGSKNRSEQTQQQPKPGAALATVTGADIGNFLKERRALLADYAIRSYKQGEFMRSANIAIAESPKLRDALKTRAGQTSLYNALRHASSTGISLNPQHGKAALIPYKNQDGELIINYQIMKAGLIDLVMETGLVKDIVSDLVREKDEFNINRTDLQDTYLFSPARRARGSIDGYFAAITLKSGRTHVNYMAIEEMKEHEAKYNSSKKLGERSPWAHSFDGMAIKTVIKKLLRNIHLSDVASGAIATDDHSEFNNDVIDVDGEPMPLAESPPTESEPDPDQKGASADDVAAQLAASDTAADEQAGAESESTETETPAI